MKLTQDIDGFLLDEIEHDLTFVEKEMFDHLETDPPLLGEIASYLIKAGGKRVRPALTLLAFRAAGGEDIQKVVPIAAAIELIHTASLIHDDINDGSQMRRGLVTCNREFGDSNALVSGDYLFVKAFRIGGMYDWEIVKIIADACTKLAEGEIMQSSNRYNTDLSLEDYFVTIHKKTASLIKACVHVGGVLGNAQDDIVDALTRYADHIGMVFQITDDILDVKGTSKETGKPMGNDICEGQLSIVSIKALEMTEGAVREELRKIIQKEDNTPGEITRAIEIIMGTDSTAFAYDVATEYAEKAREELMKLPETEYRDNLELIIEIIMERYY